MKRSGRGLILDTVPEFFWKDLSLRDLGLAAPEYEAATDGSVATLGHT